MGLDLAGVQVINPDCTVPVLELSNENRVGGHHNEICARNSIPSRGLIGRTAEEKAMMKAWQRRIERDGFGRGMFGIVPLG